MSNDAAALIVLVLAACATAAWATGIAFTRRRLFAAPRDQFTEMPIRGVSGEVRVQQGPSVVRERMLECMRQAVIPGRMGCSVMVRRAEGDTIEGRLLYGAGGPGSAEGLPVTLRLSADGGGTRVTYEADTDPALRGLRIGAVIFHVVGLIAIPTLGYVLLNYAAPSSSPGARGQVVQMIQIVHVLWPPFLLGYLGGRLKAQTRVLLEGLATSAGV